MIREIVLGDITSPKNHADIIIGMNSTFTDVLGLGRRFIKRISAPHPITLGSVVSFKYDGLRQIHMLVCHEIGRGGWENSQKHVRYGLDYLWHCHPDRKYSIVEIGNGRVGRRDGANPGKIKTAIATSFLPVTLFVFDDGRHQLRLEGDEEHHLEVFRFWNGKQERPINIPLN